MQIQELTTNPSEESHPPGITIESSVREQLLEAIEQTPDEILATTLEFLTFLKLRQPKPSPQKPHSTAASLLKTLERIGKWEGDDFEECLELVRASRSRFYVPADDIEDENVEVS